MNTPPQQPPYGQPPYEQSPYEPQQPQPPQQPQQPLYGQPQQPPAAPPPYGQPQPPYEPYAPQPGYPPPAPPPPGMRSPWGPSSIGMEPNVSAGLSYLVGIIAIIFFFMEKQNRFVRFHAAQSILLSIAYVIFIFLWLAIFFVVVLGGAATGDVNAANTVAGFGVILLTLCLGVVVLGYLGLWIWGLVAAFSNRVVKLPLIGAIAERWAGGPVVPMMAPPAYGR